jgi:hypothetical protein
VSAMTTEEVMLLWPLTEQLGLSVEETADIQDAISKRNAEYIANPTTNRPRQALQDFSSLADYFPSQFWIRWQRDEVADPLSEICDLAIALGARNLTEITFQLWTALLLMLQNKGDARKCAVLTPLQKNEVSKHVKRVFRRRVKAAGARLIEDLPKLPSELLSTEPGLYVLVYGSNSVMPLQCLFHSQLEGVASTVKMRNCGGSGSTTMAMQPGQQFDMSTFVMQFLSQQGMDMFRRQGLHTHTPALMPPQFPTLQFSPPAIADKEEGGMPKFVPPALDTTGVARATSVRKLSVSEAAAAVRTVMSKVRDHAESEADEDEEAAGEGDSEARPTKPKAKSKSSAVSKKKIAKAGAKAKGSDVIVASLKKTKVMETPKKKLSYTISDEATRTQMRCRFNDKTSFSMKYGGHHGPKATAIRLMNVEAKKMLDK